MSNIRLKTLEYKNSLDESKIRAIHQMSGPGVIHLDQTGKISKLNQRFLYMIGYQKYEVANTLFMHLLDEEDYNIFQIEFANLLIQRSESFSLEIRLVKENKEKIWIKITATTVKRTFKDVLILATIEDITERKIAEAKYQQVSNELEAFLYRASHDLRGPLATLTGICNLVQLEFNDPKMLGYFEMIRNTSERMKDAVHALHKITDVKFSELKIERIFFEPIFDKVFTTIGNNFKEASFKHEIEIKLTDPFFSDRDLIFAILFNIIDNSIKFRRSNRKIEPVIKISVTQKILLNKFIEITLEDNGNGIPIELYDKIFQLFYRGDFRSRGSGLGLYIVDRAVRKLSGEITVSPSSMNGTCFKILLPY